MFANRQEGPVLGGNFGRCALSMERARNESVVEARGLFHSRHDLPLVAFRRLEFRWV